MNAQTKQRKRQQQEVDANYETFQKQLPELLGQYAGKYALLKDREVVEMFDSQDDAWTAGRLLFKKDIFSVQKVDNRPLQLGWMGYALLHHNR